MRSHSVVLASLLAAAGVDANLNQLAKAAGKLYFGSATDNGELSNTAYTSILSNVNEFGQITPGNGQKWQYTEPSQGSFSFTQGDAITTFAKNNGQLLRCHTLVWHSQLPSWVSSGSWTNATLASVIQTHIAAEVGHYKGQCYAWDVVNEAIDDSGNWRTSVFYNVMGTSFLPVAFAAAAAADPAAKLYYNDYNIESAGAKATRAVEAVNIIKAAGARIDGVGLQGHFIVGSTPSASALTSQLNTFVALGVEVAYTEIDVRFSSLPSTASGLAQQANDYAAVVQACLNVAKCVGITVWDFDDAYSWIPSTFSGQGDACLYWSNLTTKPAYDKIQNLLASAAGTTLPSSTTLTTKTTTAASATATATGTAAHWAQCGGVGYTGPTVCAAPYTCTYSNDWYSQCL
ncbi:family 10 glycosyl hydrolase [Thozetella sp. PMI_491]|nr:family 10 glycosyl hydrolase [Thozetella sp. PMI_491]